MADIWCRSCGGRIFEEGVQLALDNSSAFQIGNARMNVLMQCLGCVAPGHKASPTATRIQDRILYHLITKGIVRVGFSHGSGHGPTDLPKGIKLDELTDARPESVRTYLSQAVSKIPGIWISTHLHMSPSMDGTGYVLGHLRTARDSCNCKMM